MNGLDAIQASLEALERDEIRPAACCEQVRAQAAALALPDRYREVLSRLLDSLEASALFTEESCSFSQRDLLESLRVWIARARELA